jgi:hypothetical protein
MGHDTGARLHRIELREKLRVVLCAQVQHDNGSVTEIEVEDVALFDGHEMFDVMFPNVSLGVLGPQRVNVDSHCAAAISLGGEYQDPPIAAAQVVNDIVFADTT